MIFKITGVKDNKEKTFYYDNMNNYLKDEFGKIYKDINIKFRPKSENNGAVKYTDFSPEKPLKKSKEIHILKIQLGLTCNYACEYCSQRFIERPKETSKKHIKDFIEKLDVLEFNERKGLRIELWGGEPFLYWKTMVPLVEALKEKFSHWKKKPEFSVITNGSILTDEMIDWFEKNMTGGAISHDGPGQPVRGPDPMQDDHQKEMMIKLYKRMKGRLSFNSMVNSKNMSRIAIRDWFIKEIGDKNISIGEGAFVDAYDEGAIGMSLDSYEKHFEYRKLFFKEIYENRDVGFAIIRQKIKNFIGDVSIHNSADFLTQKCGMDLENVISIDLKGNVLTCQNTSAVSVNENGESHFSGTLDDYDNVKVTTSTHWSNREECSGCPVLHICRGACMYASGKYWKQTCENSYSDNVPIFAKVFEMLTGHVPILIDGEGLPNHRKDIWGVMMEHKEEPKKKSFPIPVVAG